ncbi:MAG: flagellar FliJ family protein [Burkholderiales bacterium]|nr:flagellar FliJ family protein [Burkholderiales bacterium]
MTQALQTLLEHAEHARDAAQAALLQAEDAVRSLRQQAQQLHGYRDEYAGRHPALGGRSATVELLRCHSAFMQRLEQAVAQLQLQLHAAETRVPMLRAELLALELRVASVARLQARRGAAAQLLVQRQEQRRSDDAHPRRRREGQAPGWALETQPAVL